MKLKKISIGVACFLLINCSYAAGEQSAGALAPEHRGKFRLPEIKTVADVDALTHLTPEEKAFAKIVLKKVPDSNGWAILGNDPELQVLWHMMEREYIAFNGFQGVPFSHANLVSIVTAKHANSDYIYGLFAALTVRQVKAYKMSSDYDAKLAMLDSPDSTLWSDEERLIIKFTRASLENKMTDELFAQARKAWGEKKLLRSLAWQSYVQMWSITANTLNMKFYPEMLPPGFAIPPEAVTAIDPVVQKTRKQLQEFVADKLTTFPGR